MTDPDSKDRDTKLYSKLYVSCEDLRFSSFCASVLLKNSWHSHQWERRGKAYEKQAAFTTALVVAYGRIFTTSRGWPGLPKRLIPYGESAWELHARLLKLRDTIYAHSDSDSYRVEQLRVGPDGQLFTVFGSPSFRFTVEELRLFEKMSGSLSTALNKRMAELILV